MVHDYSEEYAQELLQKVREKYGTALRALADAVQE
jgi:hypothetical protein